MCMLGLSGHIEENAGGRVFERGLELVRLNRMEKRATAEIEGHCPVCERFNGLRLIDMLDDDLPDIWVCTACGWSE